MYLGIDVGGSHTRIATYDESGNQMSKKQFDTPQDYSQFLSVLSENLTNITINDIKLCVMAVPGLLDRQQGIIRAITNLPWQDKPIASDVSQLLGRKKVLIENDARLAGLAEAIAHPEYSRVLYLTISTGIGGALAVGGKLVKELEDTEVGHMPIQYNGQQTSWEQIASGRSLVERYKIEAHQITDPKQWEDVGTRIAFGVGELCAVLRPDTIVFGGGVGQYADKFTPFIASYLKEKLDSVVPQPKALLAPKYCEDSVLRGCYELAKQQN